MPGGRASPRGELSQGRWTSVSDTFSRGDDMGDDASYPTSHLSVTSQLHELSHRNKHAQGVCQWRSCPTPTDAYLIIHNNATYLLWPRKKGSFILLDT